MLIEEMEREKGNRVAALHLLQLLMNEDDIASASPSPRHKTITRVPIMAMFRQPLMSLTRSSTTRFVACPSLIALESRQRRGAHSKHAFTAAPVELSYDEFGPEVHEDGRPAPIVILHGLFGSKRNWRSIAVRRRTFDVSTSSPRL